MELLTLREKIILVFVNEKTRCRVYDNYPATLATSDVRSRLGNYYSCTRIRKELTGLEKEGYLHKDIRLSRGGKSIWRWDK